MDDYSYTNLQPGQDFYTMAGQSYNDNPFAAQGGEGGNVWVPNTPQATPAAAPPAQNSSTMQMALDAQNKILNAQNPPMQNSPISPNAGSRTVNYGAANVGAQQPYLGGPQGTVAAAGYQPPGAMPTTLMDKYKAFITDPQGGLNSDIFKAILDKGQQGAERGALASGMNGTPGVSNALQNNAIATAGTYLPSMAGTLQQGAQTESQRYGTQSAAQQGAGNLGLGEYNAGAASQLNTAGANYGITQDQMAQQQAQQAQQPINQLMTMMMQRQMQGY